MKAISLYQPWATLVATRAKRLETRGWYSAYRGTLAIHASKKFTAADRALCFQEPFRSALEAAGYHHPNDLPLGAVVATATLSAVQPITERNTPPEPERSFGNYSVPGRFAFVLDDVTPLPIPIPAKGALSLWEWDEKGLKMSEDGPEDEKPEDDTPQEKSAPSGRYCTVKGIVTWAGLPEPIEIEHSVEVEGEGETVSADEAVRIIEEGIRGQYELANEETLEWTEGPHMEFSDREPAPTPREWHIKASGILPDENATAIELDVTLTALSDEEALLLAVCQHLKVEIYDLNTITWNDLAITPGAEQVKVEEVPPAPAINPLTLLEPSHLQMLRDMHQAEKDSLEHLEEQLNKAVDKVSSLNMQIRKLKKRVQQIEELLPPAPEQWRLL